MKISLSGNWLKSTAITATFFPLIAFVIYVVIGITKVFTIFSIVWMSVSMWGIIWCFFAMIFALIALWNARVGGILIIIAGFLFFSSVLFTNHYPQIYLPVSGIYIIGGVFHLLRSFQDPRKLTSI